MRMRFWLYLLFGVFTLLPLALLGWYTQDYVARNETNRSLEKTRIVVNADANAIASYLSGMHAALEARIDILNQNNWKQSGALEVFGPVNEIVLADASSGRIIKRSNGLGFSTSAELAGDRVGYELLTRINSELKTASRATAFSESDSRAPSFVYLARRLANRFVIASVPADTMAAIVKPADDGSIDTIVIDSLGTPVFWNGNKPGIRLPDTSIASRSSSGSLIDVGGSNRLSVTRAIGDTSLRALAVVPMASTFTQLASTNQSVSTAIIVALIMVLLASLFASHIFSRPLERLIAALHRTENSNFEELELEAGMILSTEHIELQQSFNSMIGRLREADMQLKTTAFTDPVTDLPNRKAFKDLAENALETLGKGGMSGYLVFIDIDHFKEINDTLGHFAGDQVLRTVALRVAGIVETITGHSPLENPLLLGVKPNEAPKVIMGRQGGDEFLMFIPETSNVPCIETLMEHVQAAISKPIPGVETTFRLTGSIGIATFPQHGVVFNDLLKRADIAMYHAKKTGKARVEYFRSEIGERTTAEIRRDVHEAIRNGEMELYFQPKITSVSGEVKSAEALIRWISPKDGIVPPGQFIPAIEESDVSNELGEWVIRNAAKAVNHFKSMGHDITVAINISSYHFASQDFVGRLKQIVREEHCPHDKLEIEITEESALDSTVSAANIIGQLQDAGFNVALDDYGRGYSNLTRLAELKVNTIKIDGPLTARITRDARTRVIFEATINMARGLNCKTVAEGVETAEEAAMLTKLGCSELQGFLFSTPLPSSAFLAWMKDRNQSEPRKLQEKIAASF